MAEVRGGNIRGFNEGRRVCCRVGSFKGREERPGKGREDARRCADDKVKERCSHVGDVEAWKCTVAVDLYAGQNLPVLGHFGGRQ